VLCDFGLVSAVRATRVSAGRGGTPLYQAPETWWRKGGEPAQDWWSLGIMVAEMLIGHNPNTGPDGTAPDERVLFEHLATHDVDLSGIQDPRWQLLCRGLLTRSPEDRWGRHS
jgi:serine/threonine protein kinase